MSQQPPAPPPQGPPPRYLPPPQYPPGQPPLEPRRREPQHSPVMAPVLALVGLLLVAAVSLAGFSFLGLGPGSGSEPAATPVEAAVALSTQEPVDGTDPIETVDPTEEPVIVRATLAPIVISAPAGERPDVNGTILFSRDGDIWSASGEELRRLTNSGADTAPTWTSDGRNIYFVRTGKRTTKNSRPGGLYTLYFPDIWRMKADGSDRKRIYSSLIKGSSGLWFSHVLEPDISPDGKTLAVVSDGPNGDGDAVVLHMLNSKPGSRLRRVSANSWGDMGHNDPAWSPDGKKFAYTRNRNVGSTGIPTVGIYTCKTRKNCTQGKNRLLKPGYANPSWSPDATWLAVESTRGTGRDIVIVNVKKGDPRVVLTRDGNSFAPVVSPDGDQIAYLHRDGVNIDLRVMTLDLADDGKITLIDDRAVTTDGAIDAESPPAWFIPESQLKNQPELVEAIEETTQDAEQALEALGS